MPASQLSKSAGAGCVPASTWSSTSGAPTCRFAGGASGLLVRDYMGKEAGKLVTRIDLCVVSLVAELRGHERQAAEELEQWKHIIEERKVIDASRAAITLAMLLTDEELNRWRRRLDLEKSRGADDQVDQMSQALNRLRAMVLLPGYAWLNRLRTLL